MRVREIAKVNGESVSPSQIVDTPAQVAD